MPDRTAPGCSRSLVARPLTGSVSNSDTAVVIMLEEAVVLLAAGCRSRYGDRRDHEDGHCRSDTHVFSFAAGSDNSVSKVGTR